jgi:myo-inositol 2-dehydrogenase/D-chiro-inositol 1-dehydrogenase
MRAIALHPPGENADPYYQVALSRQENGAIVVPDLPTRLHPAIAILQKTMREGPSEGSKLIRYDVTVEAIDGDLTGQIFPRVVDVARALMGEVRSVTATGLPAGTSPTESLTVHLRGSREWHAEIRIQRGLREAASLAIPTADGGVVFEHDLDHHRPARLIRRFGSEPDQITELGVWDAKNGILAALSRATPDREPEPGLLDGTRAMELSEAVLRSLRKARTIDLDYEEMSEVGNFKSIMTSVGCGLLLAAIAVMFIAAAGKSLGFESAVYLAWAIPPALVGFALFQLLRYGIKQPHSRETKTHAGAGTAVDSVDQR